MTHLRGARLAVAALSIAAAACTGVATSIGGKPGPEAGLLRGRLPLRSAHVTHVDRLTDGIAAYPDDPSRTELTSLFGSSDAFVVYDLGAETRVACAAVDADSDDSYTIALSADGVSFAPLWTAPAVPDRGVQPRAARDLDGHGRYLRLTASGGDGAYAVAEVSVAAECPPRWPPVLAPQYGTPADSSAATKAWLFAALAAAYVLAYRRKLPDFFKLLVAAPLGVLIALLLQLSEIWPPPSSLLLPLFAAPAIVGAAVGIRMVISRRGRGARSTRT
ncbi:MAG TPA: hypothetical protein VN903_04935 [Polyangia bacterium]|nr:hypothetical protein [Polyangia bacterium]